MPDQESTAQREVYRWGEYILVVREMVADQMGRALADVPSADRVAVAAPFAGCGRDDELWRLSPDRQILEAWLMNAVFKNLVNETLLHLRSRNPRGPAVETFARELRGWARRTRRIALEMVVAAPTKAAMLRAAEDAEAAASWPTQYLTISDGAKMRIRDVMAGAGLWAIQELRAATRNAARNYAGQAASDYDQSWPELFHPAMETGFLAVEDDALRRRVDRFRVLIKPGREQALLASLLRQVLMMPRAFLADGSPVQTTR